MLGNFRFHHEAINLNRFNNCWPIKSLVVMISPMIALLLILLPPIELGHTVWDPQLAFGQDSFENPSTQTENRLDKIIELLEKARQGSIIQTIPDHYCFYDGTGVCNLWTLHWSGA